MMPVVIIRDIFATSYSMALSIHVLVVCIVVWLLSLSILRNIEVSAKTFAWSGVILLFALCLLPGYQFSRHVHFSSAFVTPYICLAAARITGVRTHLALAIFAGMLAGVGIGIKPTYVLIIVFLEMSLLTSTRSFGVFFRAETYAFVSTLLAAAGFTVVFYPLYVGEIVPMALATYHGYDNRDAIVLVLKVVLVLVALAALYRDADNRTYLQSQRHVFSVAIVASLICYALQGKGWFYQAYPAVFFFFLYASYGLMVSMTTRMHIASSARIMLALGLVFAFARSGDFSGNPENLREVETRIRQSEEPFYIISVGVYPAFPMAVTLGKTWASRFSALDLLPGIVSPGQQDDERRATWEAYLRQSVTEDMGRYRPKFVFVPIESAYRHFLPPGFDILSWLLRGPGFAAEWSHYHLDGKADGYFVFERRADALEN
jgi:hypothetical protein